MTLRIALELYLKRAVVGGIDRVFEIGKNFRNEGIDSTHFPEFTMLEFYEAYGDYDTVADLTRVMVLEAARAIGRTVVADGAVDLEAPWRSATLHELLAEVLGEPVDAGTPLAHLVALAAAHEVALQPGWDAGEVALELFEKLVEHTLVQPTFVRDYPVSARPLARQHRDDPRLAEAWDLVVGGVELATGYSELVDPVEQRDRVGEAAGAEVAAGDLPLTVLGDPVEVQRPRPVVDAVRTDPTTGPRGGQHGLNLRLVGDLTPIFHPVATSALSALI